MSRAIRPLCLAIAAAILAAFQLPLSARIWTQTATGKTIEGDLVKVESGTVHLRLAGNQLVQVPITDLSPDDVTFIEGRTQATAATAPTSAGQPAAPDALAPLTKDQVAGVREWSDGAGGFTKGTFDTLQYSIVHLDLERVSQASRRHLVDENWPLADLRIIWHAQALHYSQNALGPATTDPALLSKVAISTSKDRLNSKSSGNMVNTLTGEVVKRNVTKTTRGTRYFADIEVPFGFTGELTLIWNNQTIQVLPVDFSLERDFHQLLLKAEADMKPLSGAKDEHAARIAKLAGTLYAAANARQDWHKDQQALAKTEHLTGSDWRFYFSDEHFYTTDTGFYGVIGPAQKLPDLLKAGGSREASTEFRELRDSVSRLINSMSKACVNESIWTTSIEPVFPTTGDTDEALLVIKSPNGQELAREVLKADTVKSKIN